MAAIYVVGSHMANGPQSLEYATVIKSLLTPVMVERVPSMCS